MRKFRMYNVKFTIISLAAVFVMFAAPTTASAAPTASVSGPGAVTIGYTATFNASLTGSARSGQIWITKGDGRSTFSCPQGPGGAPYRASSGFYWCPIANPGLSGTYQFVEYGTYTTVVNAFNSTNATGSGPADQCSGTPASLGFNSSVWSDCGSSDNFTTTVYAPPTPSTNVNTLCTSTNTSNDVTISWGSSNPAITYIDISTNNFASWYNKYVGGTNSTYASSGFNGYYGVSGSLTLQPNTTYYVRAWNGYALSGTAAFRTPNGCPPSAPTNPAGSCPSPGTTASLSWTGSSGATRYDVYAFDTAYGVNWSSACGSNGRVVCSQVNGTSFSFSTTPGRNYQWYVFACNSYGCSTPASYSTSFTCTPPSCNTNLDCDLCSVPSNTCSTNNGTQTCYYRAYTGGGSCNVVSFSQSCTRSNCSSGYSCIGGSCIAPPPAPTNPAGSCPIPGTTASLSWTGSSGATRYDVYAFDTAYGVNWSSACGSNGRVVCSQVNGTSFSFSTTPGRNYQWYVFACNSAGCNSTPASYSTTFTCIPTPPPPTASITAPANNSFNTIGSSMTVNATANGTNLTKVNVYRAPATSDLTLAASWTQIAENASCSGSTCSLTSSWTPTAGEGGQWVIAVNAFDSYDQRCSGMQSSSGYWTAWCGRNGTTSNVTVNVVPPTPTSPTGSCPIPGTTANLNWSGVSGASRYDVFGFDLAYGSPNWDSPCGSNGRVVCSQVNGTSFSFSTTPGRNYQWYVFACNSAGCNSTPASYSTTFTCLYNNAQYVSQSCPPSNMTPGQTASAWVIMNNNGNTTWPASSTYRLGSQNPQDNTTWGSGRIIPGSSIPPGSNYTFSSTVTAPSTPGTYNFQWRMVQEGVEWFGGTTPNCSVTVAYPPPRASVSGLSAATVGYTATFNATLSGSARSGQIWITKGDGRSTFSCPQGEGGVPYRATTGYYWCPVARQNNTTSLSGTYQFVELGTYTTVVNAFSNAYQAGTGPSDQCSGTPASLGFNSAIWSDCGSSDNFITTIYRPPTPSGSVSASCIPEATISWAGSNPAITYVDISEDSNFSTFYNKYVAGTTSTSASSGFGTNGGYWNGSNWSSNTLILKPNTTYYLRSWNGYDISYPPSSFRTNDCPPRGNVSGPSAMAVGDNLTFSATLSGSARSGQIWITKGDGRSTFSCPQGEGGVPYRATTGYYWCPVARQNNTTSLSGTYTFAEPGSYTSVVNAFSNPYQLGTGPSDQCSGTPSSLGFNSATWSDCGSNDNVITVNAIPQASVSGPSTTMRGEPATFTATLSGGARSATLWITKGDGRSVFPCPTTIYYASTGRFWCGIGNGAGSTVTGTYRFVENGTYTVVVNAYATSNQTGTGPSDQCSGTPTELGVNPSAWSDCGSSDNVATTVTYVPAATLTGSSRGTKGSPSTFTATLLGSAQSAQIWITKGNGQSNFYCNGAENNAYRASTGYYWCNIGSGAGSTVTGSYTFPDTDRYTAVVNAYNSTNQTGSNPTNQCTGTPTYLGFNSSTWSDCGANDYVVTTSSPPAITNCGSGTVPRAEGLVTTPSLTGNFPTSPTGRCVKDSATAFKPFKIPSYEDLKFVYYTQSKAIKIQSSSSNLNPTTSGDDGKVFNYTSDVNVVNSAPYSGTAIIFIEGNLNITKDITTSDRTKGLVFVVKNNVVINKDVTRIDAVIISGGTIYTADTGCSRSNVPAEQLVVNGSLVSLDTGNMIFCRALSDNALPAEKINSDPKYLVILRDLYADIVQRWSEIP